MYICDVCNNPVEVGTQYVNVFDKCVCLDCSVRNTLDDIMSVFGITYTEAPEEIIAEGVLVYDDTDSIATSEQVENFFHSENPVFVPTQVGENERVIEYKNAREASWTPEYIEEWQKKVSEMTAYIHQCDTMEQFIEKYPGMEDYWDAEVEGK